MGDLKRDTNLCAASSSLDASHCDPEYAHSILVPADVVRRRRVPSVDPNLPRADIRLLDQQRMKAAGPLELTRLTQPMMLNDASWKIA
jgi:hypothetical protein